MPADALALRVRSSLEAVGLGLEFLTRYRHQLSGGQQQRVNIARAIAIEPSCIVLDEPVAALDTAIKRDVVLLLNDLQRKRNLAYLLISHDLRVIRMLCSRVIVLFRGRIVEMGPADIVTSAPKHPYTQQLLSALAVLPGEAGLSTSPKPAELTQVWSLENQEMVPPIGNLVEVSSGHYVANEG
jgi:ABC-type oligopeptide transport system ATPase subunit